MRLGSSHWWSVVSVAAGLSFLATLNAVPPANDGYSNRFVIVSSPLVVTTSLAEATGDYYPDWMEGSWIHPSQSLPQGIGSVWWTATLTNSCSLTVEFLEYSGAERADIWEHIWAPWCDCRRGGIRAGNSTSIGKVPYVTARVTNGSPANLDVQITGNAPRLVLRFTIHTAPLVITAPQNRTATPGESVFFGVGATGHNNLQYQWLHNGQPLPGETFPILALNQVTASNAGAYRVIITDALGTNSAEATLTVSETNTPPQWVKLQRLSDNDWRGLIQVEPGRSYRVESSLDLVNWSPLTKLVQESSVRFGTQGAVSNSGVVFLPHAVSELRFSSSSSHQFFRASSYEPVQSECHRNLKMIRFAKELWALARQKPLTDPPFDQDLFGPGTYFPRKPECPTRGITTVRDTVTQPECSVHSPLLEPSW